MTSAEILESYSSEWNSTTKRAPGIDGNVTPQRRESAVSRRAHALGFHTIDDLKAAVLRQRGTWWQGRAFHCALCDLDFVAAGRAAEHVVTEQHPVLRMDDRERHNSDAQRP